jgi:hypothetical protein
MDASTTVLMVTVESICMAIAGSPRAIVIMLNAASENGIKTARIAKCEMVHWVADLTVLSKVDCVGVLSPSKLGSMDWRGLSRI